MFSPHLAREPLLAYRVQQDDEECSKAYENYRMKIDFLINLDWSLDTTEGTTISRRPANILAKILASTFMGDNSFENALKTHFESHLAPGPSHIA